VIAWLDWIDKYFLDYKIQFLNSNLPIFSNNFK